MAFGVLALSGFTAELSSAELRDREDFVIEAASLMRDRFLLDDVWERMGIDVAEGKAFVLSNPIMEAFRMILFSKIVPNLNKLGLLTPRVRDHFEQLGVLHYTDAPDSATSFDPDLLAD